MRVPLSILLVSVLVLVAASVSSVDARADEKPEYPPNIQRLADRLSDRWSIIMHDGEDLLYSFDTQRWPRRTGSTVMGWIRADFHETREWPSGDKLVKYDHFLDHVEIRCDAYQFRVRSSYLYTGPDIVHSFSEGEWGSIIPDSYGETVFTFLCEIAEQQ